VDDLEALSGILSTTVRTFENSLPQPWSLDTGSDFFQKMVRAVVGFRVEITRLEGKWKLNQNHPQERREKVIGILEKSEDQNAKEIARLMGERPV
jgi:transcriptional regulator